MSKSQIPGEHVRILTDEFLAIPITCYQQRSLGAALALFLDTATKTALHRAELVSKSALSRLLNEYDWDTAQGWAVYCNVPSGTRCSWLPAGNIVLFCG